MKTRYFPIVLAVFALMVSSMACALGGELGLSNARTAHDEDGKDVASTFAPNDAIYAVADLANAPIGTTVTTKWYAVSVEDTAPNTLFEEVGYTVQEDSFSGLVRFYFDGGRNWPAGTYAVEFYLNGTLVNTVTYTVQ